jgi:type IV pilus assembly protein PilQ
VRLQMLAVCAVLLAILSSSGTLEPAHAEKTSSIPLDRPVSLDLRDLDLRSALKLIAEQHGFNVVAGDEVQGMVTGHFENVPLGDVLESILHACGYEHQVIGDVIVVTKPEENATRWGETRVFELSHASGKEVKKAVEKLLSPRGTLQLFPEEEEQKAQAVLEGGREPRMVIVHDERDRVERIASVVATLDKAPKQLMIEVRMVETVITNDLELGFDWTATGSVDGNTASQNLPLDKDRFKFGTLSLKEFQVVLHTLKEDGNSRLISHPRITTEENREAKITVGTVFPVRTVNLMSEAGVTQNLLSYEDKEIDIELSVTPQVLADSLINLVVKPTVEDIIGWTGEYKDQPITSKRQLVTRLTVRDGETIAMGGLIKESDLETVRRVWFLGRIPLLGRLLFTSVDRTKETTDMLIFITPHVVPS